MKEELSMRIMVGMEARVVASLFASLILLALQADALPSRVPLQKDLPTLEGPGIVLNDAHRGLYDLQWTGSDGRLKVVKYQRPDAIDVVVRASVERRAGKYRYVYTVVNLESSGERLNGFTVQTLASDAVIVPRAGVFVGPMGSFAPFASGKWFNFAPVSRDTEVPPGVSATFRLDSASSPGVVECRVNGGTAGIKAVGEELPQGMEGRLLRYEAWPHGHTIGPTSEIASMSDSRRAARLNEWLKVFRDAGWIADETSKRYGALLAQSDLSAVADTVPADLAAGRITDEVAAVVLGLRDKGK